MTEKTTTRVIFRTWRPSEGGGVIAILLDVPANRGCVMMYAHVGQHGEGSYLGVMSLTRPSTEAEYANLAHELRQIGYHLLIRKRRTIRWLGDGRKQYAFKAAK